MIRNIAIGNGNRGIEVRDKAQNSSIKFNKAIFNGSSDLQDRNDDDCDDNRWKWNTFDTSKPDCIEGSSMEKSFKYLQWQQLGKVWETSRLEVLNEIFSPDIVYHLSPFPDMNLESLKGFIADFCKSFPDMQVKTEEEVILGNVSIHRWSCSASYTGESSVLSVAPTGKSTAASGCHIFHWQDGKPVEIWHFGDWLGWLQGAGVIPPLG